MPVIPEQHSVDRQHPAQQAADHASLESSHVVSGNYIVPPAKGYHSTTMKRLLETRTVFLTIVFMGLFGMAVRNMLDPDVWWHLKSGEYIAAHKAVPH